YLDGQIQAGTRIIGTARSNLDGDAFRKMVEEGHKKFAPGICVDEAKCAEFFKMVHYVQLDGTAPKPAWAPLQKLLGDGEKIRIFYLATAPSLFVPIAQRLGETGLAKGDARIVLEKPIGRDLQSAKEINDGVGAVFDEKRTFRIDHYLGKETVQN